MMFPVIRVVVSVKILSAIKLFIRIKYQAKNVFPSDVGTVNALPHKLVNDLGPVVQS